MNFLISIVFSLILCHTAHAHRPIFSERVATEPNTAVLINQPNISQVIYREITEDAKQVWLGFDAEEGFRLFVQIGIPVLEHLKDFRPAMLVVGPGLPENNLEIDLPKDMGAKYFTTDSIKEPRFFHEHFTGTDSWILRSEDLILPKSGRYYVVAFVPSKQKGKLWLSIGRKEVFGLKEWAQFGKWKKRIRKFHEVTEKKREHRIPILSEIVDLFKSSENVETRIKKPNSNEKKVKVQDNVKIHTVKTKYQNGKQEIRVLLPDKYNKERCYRVLYVLPVEKGFEKRYGYGLGILEQMNAHNTYDIIVVQMGFEKEPWFGDHATDTKARQASYLKEFVVPFVEKHYSTMGTPEGRLLIGFSKSGWGAFSLIMTYPEFFGYAASWDGPMLFDKFHYSMEQVYGNLDQLNVYRPDILASKQKQHFQKKTRLVLTGEKDWGKSIPTPNGGSHTAEMHLLLKKEGIKHVYDNNIKVPHRWDERWINPTLESLLGLPKAERNRMQLWHKVDISSYKGSFVCLGDLTGDQCADFLLYREGPQTTPGFMAALDHEGRTLWELGDNTLDRHKSDGQWNEPALRGIAFIYDLNQDGKGEVITEFWKDGKPMFYVLEGNSGRILHESSSPLDLQVRGGKRSRCHPVGRIAFFEGRYGKPSIVLKYGASNHVPCYAVALDDKLEVLWEIQGSKHSMGHIPTVGDVDSDGKDEVILGTLMADGKGKTLWEMKNDRHADCTTVADVHSSLGKEVLISICSIGPAYCLSAKGEILWKKTQQEVPHGQGIWAGNFIGEEAGTEIIILRSGHVGDFITLQGSNGKQLAAFQHTKNYKGYPDFPCVVNWKGTKEQSLWIPIDRTVINGYGRVIADLGEYEGLVKDLLQWGESKNHIAVQAFAVDLCGDQREELVLYQPYNGEAILIFTQEDSNGEKKPYVHDQDLYNIRSYF
jgi:enterochelin esterase-like enzyme